MKKQKKGFIFRVVRKYFDITFPKMKMVGLENIPEEPCMIVGNHSQLNGPLTGELRLPFARTMWYSGDLTDKNLYPEYAMNDFWRYKSKRSKWFYKIMAQVTKPIFPYLLKYVDGIPVYKDNKIILTFKKSVETLNSGKHLVVFPECHTPYNHIVNEFQSGFVDLAKLYYKKTGKCLSFVPMYICRKLKSTFFGKPVVFDPNVPLEEQRTAIIEELKKRITDIATEQPVHTVIPYANIKKKKYPKNK